MLVGKFGGVSDELRSFPSEGDAPVEAEVGQVKIPSESESESLSEPSSNSMSQATKKALLDKSLTW